MFRVENLTKKYYGLTAVDQLSYTVAAGEIVGLIGPMAPARAPASTASAGLPRPTRGAGGWAAWN